MRSAKVLSSLLARGSRRPSLRNHTLPEAVNTPLGHGANYQHEAAGPTQHHAIRNDARASDTRTNTVRSHTPGVCIPRWRNAHTTPIPAQAQRRVLANAASFVKPLLEAAQRWWGAALSDIPPCADDARHTTRVGSPALADNHGTRSMRRDIAQPQPKTTITPSQHTHRR